MGLEVTLARFLSNLLVERVMGIEPTYSAWEADVLPLNYTRVALVTPSKRQDPTRSASVQPRRCRGSRNIGTVYGNEFKLACFSHSQIRIGPNSKPLPERVKLDPMVLGWWGTII